MSDGEPKNVPTQTRMPPDLRPLSTQPWDERPAELPLEVQECRTAIWRASGNITEASKILKVSSARLRTFIKRSPYLQREIDEARDVHVDKAEGVIFDALDDPERRDAAARFILERLGKPRGWGAQQPNVKIATQGGNVVFQWADGSGFSATPSDEGNDVIDGTATDISSE